jgi:hypothetical protein
MLIPGNFWTFCVEGGCAEGESDLQPSWLNCEVTLRTFFKHGAKGDEFSFVTAGVFVAQGIGEIFQIIVEGGFVGTDVLDVEGLGAGFGSGFEEAKELVVQKAAGGHNIGDVSRLHPRFPFFGFVVVYGDGYAVNQTHVDMVVKKYCPE